MRARTCSGFSQFRSAARMAERQLSKRTQRRLRQKVAQRLALESYKKSRMEEFSQRVDLEPSPGTSTDTQTPCFSQSDGMILTEQSTSFPPLPVDTGCDEDPQISPENVEQLNELSESDEVGGEDSDDNLESIEEGEWSASDGGLSDSLTCGDMSGDSSEGDSSDGELMQQPAACSSSLDGVGDPLYWDSCVTDNCFNTVFLSLAQRHNFTYASQNDILKLFSILLPPPARVPSSAYVLNRQLANFEKDTVVKQFCGSCSRPLEPATSCTQPKCIQAQLPRAVFVQVPLSMQLTERFEGMCIHLWHDV